VFPVVWLDIFIGLIHSADFPCRYVEDTSFKIVKLVGKQKKMRGFYGRKISKNWIRRIILYYQ